MHFVFVFVVPLAHLSHWAQSTPGLREMPNRNRCALAVINMKSLNTGEADVPQLALSSGSAIIALGRAHSVW